MEISWPSDEEYASYATVAFLPKEERVRIMNMAPKQRDKYVEKVVKPMVSAWKKKQPRRL